MPTAPASATARTTSADAGADDEARVRERPSHGRLVSIEHPLEHRIAPGARAMTEDPGRQHRDQREREDQGTEQREAHRVRHRREQPALDALEREQRQVRGDDDDQREEDRPLHLDRRSANRVVHAGLWRGSRSRSASRRRMCCTITRLPSTMMPKSIAPRLRRFAGIPAKCMQTNAKSSDSGMVTAVSSAARTLPSISDSTRTTMISASVSVRVIVRSVLATSSVRS